MYFTHRALTKAEPLRCLGIIALVRKEADRAAMTFHSTFEKMDFRWKPRTTEPPMKRECECSKLLPREHHATITAQFRPLDPSVVSGTIPAFLIGRNMEGFWVARDAQGQIGGIFLLENSAVSFAKGNSVRRGCATPLLSEGFEPDFEDRGNPLARPLASWIRLMHRSQQLLATFFDKTAKVVRRISSELD